MNETERFYYAEGRKVPLVQSRRFVAVQRPSAAAEGEPEEAAAAMASTLGFLADGGRVLDLPEYNLAVIALPENNVGELRTTAASRADSVRAAVAGEAGLELGPEVYETTEPGPEALIPIGEVIVRFKEGTAEEARQRLLRKHGLEVKQADYPEPGSELVAVPAGRDPVDVANELHESDAVEFAEPNFVVLTPRPESRSLENGSTTLPGATLEEATVAEQVADAFAELPALGEALPLPAAPPSDPGYPSQWGLRKIKAAEAWDISMGRSEVSVAIIDEGCDLSHEDLPYKTPGYDAYESDDNPTPQPQDGHGTSCAGVAAAKANNARGGAGVAPGCKILPVRIAKGIGGGFWDTTSAKVADGIRKA
ncbi:MAG: S8 family serine peptidase, partial [Gaiellales bacterium]